MTNCEIILKQRGPLMSSELSSILVSQFGIVKNTASQTITRDKKIIKIKGFYSSSQSFCYLEEHKEQINFYDNLLSSFLTYGKKYWYGYANINYSLS
jgi:hypothetical protein